MSKKRFFLSLETNDYKRLVAIAFSLFFFFCLLIAQFYKLQIIEGEKWTKQALCQHKLSITQPFMRGSFFSNNRVSPNHIEEGQPLVIDVAKFHLFIDPKSIPLEEKEKISSKLCLFFNLNSQEKNRLISSFYKESRSRKIMQWLDKNKKEEIEKWWFSYIKNKSIPKNSLFFIPDFKRSYPFGSMLGQLLHTIQEDKDFEMQGIPTGGLELYFNDYLRGRVGIKQTARSPTNPIGESDVIQPIENGADIYLTINQYIQAIVEEELEKGVKRANAKGAWAVMMDPKTGEILALGQYPPFDLSSYNKYFNDPLLIEHTKLKALNDAFEPGSIFKPITLAIAFKANQELASRGKPPLFTPSEKVATGRGDTPIKDTRLHRFLNMYMGIQKSSNVYAGHITKRVIDTFGDEWYRKTLTEVFGFGEKTMLEYPGENQGMVPTPGKRHPNGALQWSSPTPYSMAIGHNILVNSLQIVKVYGMIANFGVEVQPTLLRKIVKKDEKGQEMVIFDSTLPGEKKPLRRILEKENAAQIIRAMKFTTKAGGTSPRADIVGYTEAGKSGTSEKIIDGKYSDKLYFSSFAGFAPARGARFVLLVVVDEPEKKFIPGVGKSWHGGVCATPIFSEIGRRTLEYLGVEPDDPYGFPQGDPRSERSKSDWSGEVKELTKLYNYWNGLQ
jgi:cell division protein FtsI (penicillin-binding protein 3)